ncbi:MAG: nucleotide pyrophosphohydrolase, partial [Chloroflexi bacterium]
MTQHSDILITIVGLGPGEAGMLTRDAWEALTGASVIYLRTQRHPAVAGLPAGVPIQICDDIYEDTADLSAVYPL